MDYFKKYEQNEFADLLWNIPERKTGTINVIGGNSQLFRTSVKVAEYLAQNYPLERINTVLPDALKSKLPPAEGLLFLSSTESGSFASSDELVSTMNSADVSLVIGDLSKNSITKKAIMSAVSNAARPVLITRDGVELVTGSEKLLMNNNVTLMLSIAQLQKVCQEVYYPRMLTLSQPLIQVVETIHKLTLSYPVKLITFHSGQILIAENGTVCGIAIDQTRYSVMTLWMGELAAKISAVNLYNPNNFLEATIAALF